MRVDAAINAGILARALQLVPEDLPLLVLPPQNVGKSDEHTAFPGTLSINYETLGRLWFDLGESVHRSGGRKIIFFNSHGGQPQLIDIVCRELRVRLNMLAVNCAWFNITQMSDLFDPQELQYGIHGARWKPASCCTYTRVVRMDQARNFISRAIALDAENAVLRVEGATGIGWQTQDLNQAGACGDATRADAALGKELVARAARALAELVADVAGHPG